MRASAVVLLFGVLLPATFSAQSPPKALITRAINEANLTVLHGTVSPLAQAREDRGAVPDSLPAGRMLLMLNRPPEREAALEQFLRDVHTPGTASYHQWITPQQFGERFGAADADVEALSKWLLSHGLEVKRAAKSRQFVEFAGTAGQVNAAFHTSIHKYGAEGQAEGAHYANATEVRIPEALAGLVRGVAPTNDFRAQPQVQIAGRALYSRRTGRATPLWTEPNPFGTNNADAYPVAPEDFATQYDLGPLYQAGVTGAGQTIGIINESNIDLSLVQAYQKLFGVAGSLPQVVIDGDDPGTISGVDVEAYLDLELSGAVAPKATVNLYIASAGYLVDPLELAAVRAVEDNQASVLSVSFGQCEQFLTAAGNQFWSQLWEQAAAQGQTVLVSSGDTGSECTFEQINTVSGLASTPWNVAVGGTDFYYSDYATGGASAETLWSATNDANLGSLKQPLAEQAWNDAYGFDIIADGYQRGERYAGGGGVSNCISLEATGGACTGGYAKPAWQSGPGVPVDSARDLPDVSLYASNGANLSAVPICAYAGECASGSGADAEVLLTGGTSASAPAMAGIMALVNQKWGRQGQANNVLYALAQQTPAAFHDITVGSNTEICGGVSNPPDCVLQWNGIYGTPQYAAGPGYDQATGLGSVDANVLVNQWDTNPFKATQTALHVSSSSFVHGTAVTVSGAVTSLQANAVAPTGDVALLTNATVPDNASQTFLTLSGGNGSASINYLPGGQYELTGRYGGDGIYAASTSAPVTVKVTPEPSRINMTLTNRGQPIAAGTSVSFNSELQFNVQPTGMSGTQNTGIATGSATFTVDTTTQTVALNAAGIATWIPPSLAPGTHSVSATYSGDASYAGSSAAAVTLTVVPGIVMLYASAMGSYSYETTPSGEYLPEMFLAPGSTLQVGVTARGANTLTSQPGLVPLGTPPPSGNIQVCLQTYPGLYLECSAQFMVYSQTVTLAPDAGSYYQQASAIATFPNLAAGDYYIAAVYPGDSSWGQSALIVLEGLVVGPLPALAPTTTTLTVTPTTIADTQNAKVTVTVTGTGNGAMSPKGDVDFFSNGVELTSYPYLSSVAGATTTFSFSLEPNWFLQNGATTFTAVYPGDLANGPSVSNVVNMNVTQPVGGDFALAPQTPQVAIKSGSSGTVVLNLTPMSNFSGTITLTCTPSSSEFSCSVAPGSVALSGTGTATVTIHAKLPQSARIRQMPGWPTVPLSVLAVGLLLMGRKSRGRLRGGIVLMLCAAGIAALGGCGGGGGGTGGGGNPPPANGTPAGVYSVLLTGTANQIVHNVKLTVVVQ